MLRAHEDRQLRGERTLVRGPCLAAADVGGEVRILAFLVTLSGVTLSGVTLGGVGSAFWGAVAGSLAPVVQRARSKPVTSQARDSIGR